MESLKVSVSSVLNFQNSTNLLKERRPALLDNLIQAFATAPLFIVLEVLFPLGFQPELFRKIQKRLDSMKNKSH